MKRAALVSAAALATAALFFLYWWRSERPLSRAAADRLLQFALADIDKGRPDTAAEHLTRILADWPDHHKARETQAIVAVNQRRPQQVEEAVAALPDEYLAGQFADSLALAKYMNSFGFLYQAEPLWKRLLALRPQDPVARTELLRCLRISGDNASALPLLREKLREPKVELSDLLMATAPRRYWASEADIKFMKRVGQKNEDPLTLLGYARREIDDGHRATALEILQRLTARRPDWQRAQARLALLHWQLGREDGWRRAMSRWDPTTLDDGDAWFVWGVWQRQQKQLESAVRCFGEALQRNPRHVGACSQLIVVLRELDREALATPWKPYAERLAQIETHCVDLLEFKVKQDSVRTIIQECAALGWRVEAQAWRRYGRAQWPDGDWPELEEAATDRPSPGDAALDVLDQLASSLNYRAYPLPQPFGRESQPGAATSPTPGSAPAWKLDDEAAQLGIEFRYHDGLDPGRKRAYMFEFAGPGVGVLDYDGDGWPDLHLTQGARWPVQPGDTSQRDALFRNRGDGTFAPVADFAGLGEPGYSQGPAVGDFDNDGFPDVYVCNIGPNRCYRNNGDGTFTEITDAAVLAGDEWSLSAAWADFNDDGLLDLYVVNYLAGDVYEHVCHTAEGRSVQCPPTRFPAADDRLYLNRGDGTFADVSADAGILLPDGKGMGIVVGRFDDSGRTGAFIANDTTANYLFVRGASAPGAPPRFAEVGVVSGVAFGTQGNAGSSMGVAAGDVNGDGRIDLFVTNFLGEARTLYVQGAGGVFDDLASRYGLTEAGLQTEGWGAQFLDIDADGDLDLFAANGHLEEHANQTGRMPQHLFRNQRNERFELVSTPAVGRYFGGTYLGRAAALWDWNRDGREDLCVSHTTDPVAVLTNRTAERGHALSLRLVGVQAARDPIGAQARLSLGGRSLVRELTSGDGYTASNERRLYFGLGSATENLDVDVEWPGGAVQRFTNLAVDTDYVLIEGRPTALPLTRFTDDRP